MFEPLPRLDAAVDSALRPVARVLYRRVRLTPNRASWVAFSSSVGAGAAMATGHLRVGLGLMLVGQVLDALDGGIAREYGLASVQGARLDTILDRASETVIFLGFAAARLAPLKLILLALVAIALLSTVAKRSRFDPGFKRMVLYLGLWVPYPILFGVIFAVNLAGYLSGLLLLDIKFQRRMDALPGDFDTVASRAAQLERGEREARTLHPA
jgi:phosphatidylglycerophosphate synthase